MQLPHEQTDWPWKLPLWKGGQVAAYALVDEADYEVLSDHRWRLEHVGYAGRGSHRHHVFMHRAILGLETGSGLVTDHINRDRLDNRRSNLRAITQGENAQNMGPMTGTSSVHKGVSWHPWGSWQATCTIAGVQHKLGGYLCETIAAIAAENFRTHNMPMAYPSVALDPYRAACDTGTLICSGCSTEVKITDARYWQVIDGRPLCQPCNGYVLPKRGPKFQPPKACENCGRMTNHRKRGRCDTCYAYWRRNAYDRSGR